MFSWIYIRFLYILQLKAIVLECPVTMMDSVTEVRHLPNVFVDLDSLTIIVLVVCFYHHFDRFNLITITIIILL